MKTYFTFCQNHYHKINDMVCDKDTVIQIDADTRMEARQKMFDIFQDKWCFMYNRLEEIGEEFYKKIVGVKRLENGEYSAYIVTKRELEMIKIDRISKEITEYAIKDGLIGIEENVADIILNLTNMVEIQKVMDIVKERIEESIEDETSIRQDLEEMQS